MSNSSFRIRGVIYIGLPNNGMSKEINQFYDVNWTYTGTISTVQIDYSPDNGVGTWTILTNETCSNETYNWSLVPATAVTNNLGKIRMTNKDDAACSNLSSGTFSVTGTFELLTPDGGEIMEYEGNQYEITWNVYGDIPNATLKYSTTGTAKADHTNPITTVEATNLSFNWTVPDALGSTLSVMVMDGDNSDVNDTSNETFGIKGNITVDYPYAGSGNWTVSTQEYVNWTPTGNYTADVVIDYYNGSAWNYLGGQAPGIDNQSQSYSVGEPDYAPDNITHQVARIRISTNETNASINVENSSNQFSIIGEITISSPAAGVTWYVGETTRNITWTSKGTVTPVNISYSVDDGDNWIIINATYTDATKGINNFTWNPIPPEKSELECLVRIYHNITGMPLIVRDTTEPFNISPVIIVTKPATGDNVYAGSTDTLINWTYTGDDIGNVSIFFLNDTSAWEHIKDVALDGSGSCSTVWTNSSVPGYKKTNSQIRIWDKDTTSFVTNQSGQFNIVGSLAVIQPDGTNDNWAVGTQHLISWSRTAVDYINISFTTNDSALGPWVVINDTVDTTSATNYQWNISNDTKVSNDFYVKIEDIGNPDASNNTSVAASAISIPSSTPKQNPRELATLTCMVLCARLQPGRGSSPQGVPPRMPKRRARTYDDMRPATDLPTWRSARQRTLPCDIFDSS